MNKVLMFSYGMNTNLYDMKERCPTAISMGKASLFNWKFRFAYYADVVHSPGDITHGVLWELPESDLTNVFDFIEGYPQFYDRSLVQVQWKNVTVEAWVYHMQPGTLNQPPSNNYWYTVLEGYIQHDIKSEQIDQALLTSIQHLKSSETQ